MLDLARFDNLAYTIIQESSENQVIAKQNWRALKERNVNLDDCSIVQDINLKSAEEKPIEMILQCARDGNWVLISPIQFPQYFYKLSVALNAMKDEINQTFRLFIDF